MCRSSWWLGCSVVLAVLPAVACSGSGDLHQKPDAGVSLDGSADASVDADLDGSADASVDADNVRDETDAGISSDSPAEASDEDCIPQRMDEHILWQIDDLHDGDHFGGVATRVALSGDGAVVWVGWEVNSHRFDRLGICDDTIIWSYDLAEYVNPDRPLPLAGVGVSTDGSLLVAALESNVMGFAPDGATPVWEVALTGEFVREAAVARDGSAVAVLAVDVTDFENRVHRVTVFDADGKRQWDYEIIPDYADVMSTSLAISDDGQIVAASVDNKVHVVERGVARFQETDPGMAFKIAMSGDGETLAESAGLSTVRLLRWNGSTYAQAWESRVPCSVQYCSVGSRAISRDGSTVAIGVSEFEGGGSLLLYAADGNGRPLVDTGNLGGPVVSTALSGDGAFCAAGGWGDEANLAKDLFVVDRDLKSVIYELSTPGSVMDVAISEDGSIVLAGSKHVHARVMGSEGHAYLIETGVNADIQMQIGAGRDHSCLLKNGSVVCWGDDSFGQSSPPAGAFSQLSAGGMYTCGVLMDKSVVCWGVDDTGQSSPPSGTFSQLSAGFDHACGLGTDGSIVCWGYDEFGQSSPPSGEFSQIAAGADHTCGLKEDGSVVCWGRDREGQSSPPSGAFSRISAGWYHNCGLRSDGSSACWGCGSAYDDYGQCSSPSGFFLHVSAGGAHTCGVKQDGSVLCWGYDQFGQSSPPPGSFAKVSAGWKHTCGLKTDGSVVCWGDDSFGQSSPPSGQK